MTQVPAILSSLDASQRVSSIWLSRNMERQHKHVLRDVDLLIEEAGPFEDPGVLTEKRDNGQTSCAWIPLEMSILLLSRASGSRAAAARKLILQALRYFIRRAPEAEAEIATLRSQKTPKRLPGPRAGMLPIPVTQEGMFGGPVITHYVLMPKETANDMAVAKGQLRHLQRQMEGMSKKVNRLQSKLDGHG